MNDVDFEGMRSVFWLVIAMGLLFVYWIPGTLVIPIIFSFLFIGWKYYELGDELDLSDVLNQIVVILASVVSYAIPELLLIAVGMAFSQAMDFKTLKNKF